MCSTFHLILLFLEDGYPATAIKIFCARDVEYVLMVRHLRPRSVTESGLLLLG